MGRALKVYGWTGFRSINGTKMESREIMAGYSVADVLRVTGLTRGEYYYSGGETSNEEEVRVASEEPRVVLFTSLTENKISGNIWQDCDD